MEFIYIVTLLFTASRFFDVSDCKYVEGTINTYENWVFVTRFCYLSRNGMLSYQFDLPKSYDPSNLLLYYDSTDQWPAVYKSDLSCSERTSPPHIYGDRGQIISLGQQYSSCQSTQDGMVQCSVDNLKVIASRERWWYVAISRCSPTNFTVGVKISYQLTLTNGNNTFQKHFSADEFYILEVDITFLCLMSVLAVLSVVIAVILQERQLLHSTYGLYMVSVWIECGHLLVMCACYGAYSTSGIENIAAKTFGRILESISIIVFILMLLVMAKGYTITRGRISTTGVIKLAIFITFYVVVYAIMFFCDISYFDPGLVTYTYESPAGYGLVSLRLIAWLWFCYGVFVTLMRFPNRLRFYLLFLIVYTVWFWANPFVIFIANFVLAKYLRATVVNIIERIISFLGLSFFTYLTWPSRANKNFPYHVRPDQVDVMPRVDSPENLEDGPRFTDLKNMPDAPPCDTNVYMEFPQTYNRTADMFLAPSVANQMGTRNTTVLSVGGVNGASPGTCVDVLSNAPSTNAARKLLSTEPTADQSAGSSQLFFSPRNTSFAAKSDPVVTMTSGPLAGKQLINADNIYDNVSNKNSNVVSSPHQQTTPLFSPRGNSSAAVMMASHTSADKLSSSLDASGMQDNAVGVGNSPTALALPATGRRRPKNKRSMNQNHSADDGNPVISSLDGTSDAKVETDQLPLNPVRDMFLASRSFSQATNSTLSPGTVPGRLPKIRESKKTKKSHVMVESDQVNVSGTAEDGNTSSRSS